MLLVAVLAAEGVSYVLVGSAGLYLQERALRARATPARSLATADIVAGRVEELLGTQPR